QLAIWCQAGPLSKPHNARLEGGCNGYLMGFIESHGFSQAQGNAALFCIPDSVSQTERVQTYIDFIKKNPEFKETSRIHAVTTALMRAYPCPVQKQMR
ncbi:Rap1a/Tai family immunity protein, partial [Vibrio sp. F13]